MNTLIHRHRLRQRTLGRLGLALCAATLVACGGGGGGTPAPAPVATASCAVPDQKTWVHDNMDAMYYWRDHVTTLLGDSQLLTTSSTAINYFDKLLWAPPAGLDRYSFTMTDAELALAQNGQAMGYGISWIGDTVNGCNSVRVAYVQPGSVAAVAGVQRGDTLTAVNAGALPSCQYWYQSQADLAYPSTVLTTRFDFVTTTGGMRVVNLTSGIVNEDPVLLSKVITGSDNRPIGYLMLNTFMATKARDQLIAAMQQFKTQAVQDLVLDLRYNGGGLVSIAADLAAMIGGPPVAGQTFLTYNFNARNQNLNASEKFPVDTVPATAQLGLARVYVLTTGGTASASELVINGLKPFVQVIQIGLNSYGKPVGMQPAPNCGQVYFAINFETVNASGQGGYFNGIAPTSGCVVNDNLSTVLGDPAEPMLAAALRQRSSGSCAVATAGAMLRQAPAASTVYPLRDDPVRNNMYR